MPTDLPIFPLNMTLFPQGRLPLQIFETRYLDMVKDCLRNQHGFVIVSIQQGQEVGEKPEIYNVGTYVEIIDFETLPSGLFGITVEGKQRVRFDQCQAEKSGLLRAQVEFIDNEESMQLPEQFSHLATILKSVIRNPAVEKLNLLITLNCAVEVGYRLTELLPFDIEDKQALLELDDPIERLHRLQAILQLMGHEFNIEQTSK